MRHIKLYETFRHDKNKIDDLSTIDYAYHWVNEGNLFDQIYDTSNINSAPYILRKNNSGKAVDMPALPKTKFKLGAEDSNVKDWGSMSGVCMTVDPLYLSAGITGESNVCLVFQMKDLLGKFDVINLTDNGEAEIRIKVIPDWNKLVKKIYVVRKIYETGDSWDGFAFRAVKEWFPEELKTMVETVPSQKSIGKALAKYYPNKLE